MRISYCNKEMATEVMAVTPVSRVGSGRGSKRLVWGPGRSWPCAAAAANFVGSMAPRREVHDGDFAVEAQDADVL